MKKNLNNYITLEVLEQALLKNNELIKKDTKEVIDAAVDELAITVKINFDRVEERFNKIDEKFNKIDEKFIEIDRRFDEVDKKLQGMDVRIIGVNNRLDDIAGRYVLKTAA